MMVSTCPIRCKLGVVNGDDEEAKSSFRVACCVGMNPPEKMTNWSGG